jgi:hypothetical protein
LVRELRELLKRGDGIVRQPDIPRREGAICFRRQSDETPQRIHELRINLIDVIG